MFFVVGFPETIAGCLVGGLMRKIALILQSFEGFDIQNLPMYPKSGMQLGQLLSNIVSGKREDGLRNDTWIVVLGPAEAVPDGSFFQDLSSLMG